MMMTVFSRYRALKRCMLLTRTCLMFLEFAMHAVSKSLINSIKKIVQRKILSVSGLVLVQII